jgi:hypothetical protein
MLAALPQPTSRRGIFSLIGLFNGAPDLAKRSEEILREKFAKRRYWWLTGGTWWLGARVGRSADYLSMAQFDLLSWVSGGCKGGTYEGTSYPFPRGACTIAA